MVRQDPILIAAPPRSGTTMLAGLLHRHGVWVGRSRTTMYPGTNSNFGSENIDIKLIFQSAAVMHNYKNWHTPFPDFGSWPSLKDQIEKFVPEDTRWLVKTSWNLIFWEFWVNAYPEARWLFPIRPTPKVVDSMNRHPGMKRHPDKQKYSYISHLLQNQTKVADMVMHSTHVNIEQLVDLEQDVVEDLFSFLEIEADPFQLAEWLDPKMLKR